MLSAALLFVCVVIGYIVAAGVVGLTTYALAASRPAFAVEGSRLRPAFNLMLGLIWLIASLLGGYIAAKGSVEASPQRAAELLALALLMTLWGHAGTAQQRGLVHMLLSSLFILAGCAGGCLLALHAQ